jgi:hypothetical protein
MNDKWNSWDLRLFAEKKDARGIVTNDDWRLHIKDLKDGQEIEWNRHGGFYHSPYVGSYRFTFLGADRSVRLKVAQDFEREVRLGFFNKWTSRWFKEDDDCLHRITLSIIEATYSVSELPDGVRTMQQQDHDAWEYAVEHGLI